MRRAVAAVLPALIVAAALLGARPARGAEPEPEWHSEAPVGALGVPAPLGEIGDIEFWAPNRGVLITAGVEGVTPAGVYAYDGSGWHLYSTVCGGHEGRIAWAGPDEFWTVSDYATKQEGNAFPRLEQARTLCHFVNGEVVASYAQPLGVSNGFRRMAAAACDGPADCWFGGEPLPEGAPNAGAFHVFWNGTSLTELPSLLEPQSQVDDPPGSVTGLAFLAGALFESGEEAPYLRRVDPTAAEVFEEVELPSGVAGPFRLAGDAGQLWAVGTGGGSVLRDIGTGFERVPLEGPIGEVTAAGSEPGGAGVWVGGPAASPGGTVAALRRVGADGSVSEAVVLPGPEEELDAKGRPAAISCPAVGQCWLATAEGWLFHLGGSLPVDPDPAMHALITVRPDDESTRVFVPPGLPEDDSGEREAASRGSGEEVLEPFPETRPPKKIVFDVHQRILGKRVLELTFKLRALAHVQLRARFHGKVVAKTPKLTLGKGAHRLRLKLDPKRWPTGIDFEVHPAKKAKG
jgi:hypothetical protein